MIESVRQDVRFAWRGLWRAKAFTAAAVLTLALGIAGATVVFALIRGVLLRPLPVHEQGRLIVAWKAVPSSGSADYPFGDREIEAVARASQLLESAAGVTRNGAAPEVITDRESSSYATVALVTGRFFEVLGVRPILGRAFTADDDRIGGEKTIVISSGFWQRRYGGARDVVGRRVRIGEEAFTIAGVMPPDIDYPAGVEIWQTTSSVAGPFGDTARREVNLVGRMRPGVTVTQAASEIEALHRQIALPARNDDVRGLIPVVRPFVDVVIGDVRTPLAALFAAVALVLAIAGANVANLLLMRAEARRQELAVRAALGAGRGAIVLQLFAESLLLAMLAGGAGLVVASWGLHALAAVLPNSLPRVEAIRIDAMVAAFSIAVVFATAVLAGLVPAFTAIRADLVSPLRSGGRGVIGAASNRWRQSLVVAQIALAITVVACAGLLARTVASLQSIDLGMPAGHLVLIDLYVPGASLADRPRHTQFLNRAVAEMEAVPGIAGVTPVNILPFLDRGWDVPRITAEGQSEPQSAANPSLNLESIRPNYFRTMEMPIVRGRAFSETDREASPPVAIVSDDVAARLWPGQDPIGKRLKFGDTRSSDVWRAVVGVAAPTRYRTLTTARPTLYLPAAQFLETATNLIVRTTVPPDSIAAAAASRLRAIDPGVRVMRVLPFTRMLDGPLARPRFNAFLLGMFGAAALALSTVGLYAVMAAFVRQRDREIAVRLALGATASRVQRLVLAETIKLTAAGIILGLIAAAATTRLLQGMLYGVAPFDPATTAVTALLLLGASAMAAYLPLRWASRVDAVIALRT